MNQTEHGGLRIAQTLKAHGVSFLFTLCGGHISPILTAAKALGIRVVDVRDEATAVFAADAVARLTGVPGVAAVTAGPGLTNTITAVKNAQLAQSPLVLLGGAAPTLLQGRGALQDIDQRPLLAPHVKGMRQVRRVRDLVPAVEEAFALARDGVPGPVFVECPIDLLYGEASVRQLYVDAGGRGTSIAERLLRFYLGRHVARMFAGADAPVAPRPRPVLDPEPSEASVTAAVAALGRAERPLLVVGSQAVARAAEAGRITRAVERLGIPVYLSGMGRGLLGPSHRLLMRHARRQALREADCVILAGVPCDFRLDYGRHIRRAARLISANRSAKELRMNRRPSVAALGDAGLFLQRLAERLGGREAVGTRWDGWVEQLQARDSARELEIDTRAAAAGAQVNPLAFLRALDRAAAPDAIFVADGGDFVGSAAYVLHARGPLAWLDPGAFGTLGVGAGFALGAALCRPKSEVWMVLGDGASGFGLVEFDTFVRHGIPVIGVVGNDAAWAQIARDQVRMLGDDVGTVLARTAYHEVAAAFGAVGIEVRHEAEVSASLAEARAQARAGRPVLVNVWLDRSDFREGSISM